MPIRPSDLGAIIFNDLTRKGLSQQEYANQIGVAHSTIRNLEQNKHSNVTIETLAKVAKALDMPTIALQFFEPSSEEEANKYQNK